MKTLSSRTLYKSLTEKLLSLYTREEAGSIVQLLFEEFLGLKRKDVLLDVSIDALPDGMKLAMDKLADGMPIQYILGYTFFYGRAFKVAPEVLIPRFETEELVHLILAYQGTATPTILDVGTGSGCIAITLSLELPQSRVLGVDISASALKIAEVNAKTLHSGAEFMLGDILQRGLPAGPWDLIVSNPPYVRQSEKDRMHQNVLGHEPPQALFVSDEDPLLFYNVIANQATHCLNPGGALYFEINEAFGNETATLVEQVGFRAVSVHQDLQGKDRFVRGVWNG